MKRAPSLATDPIGLITCLNFALSFFLKIISPFSHHSLSLLFSIHFFRFIHSLDFSCSNTSDDQLCVGPLGTHFKSKATFNRMRAFHYLLFLVLLVALLLFVLALSVTVSHPLSHLIGLRSAWKGRTSIKRASISTEHYVSAMLKNNNLDFSINEEVIGLGSGTRTAVSLNGVKRERKLKLTSKRKEAECGVREEIEKEACLLMINFNIIATFRL